MPVHALRRRETPVLASEPASRPTLVVAGNGMVGHRFCAALDARTRDAWRVVVLAEESRPAYDRIHLLDRIGGRSAASLELAPEEWYAARAIELRLGEPLEAIDRKGKRVRTAAGAEIAYDALVLATGSYAFRPPIEGIELDGVTVYRTLDDVERVRRLAARAREAIVVGGGLLGLEAARALVDHGLRVTVVEAGAGLLCRQVDPEASAVIRERIERLGVATRIGARPRRLEAAGARRRLRFEDGSALEADLVVVAAGIRPRDEVAARAGLAIGPSGGVLVDARLRSSDPSIFAIGECAAPRGRVYGLAAPGYRMAEVVARNLAGGSERFEGGEFSTTLKVFGAEVAILGENLAPGTWIRRDDGDGLRQIVIRDGRLVGATLVGATAEAGRLEEAIDRTVVVWPWQIRRFRRTGSFWRDVAEEPVVVWPAARLVCRCARVSRGRIAEEMRAGAASVADLSAATGAATVCGSCRPLLEQILGAPPAAPAASLRMLGALSAAALVAVVGLAGFGPIPLAPLAAGGPHLDLLWRSSLARQTTGWALLALVVFAGTIIFRRRTSLLDRFGAFARWRLVHTALGLGTLALLALHTGARLGDNLTFALAATLIGASVAGGAAGLVSGHALGLRPAASARWQRRLSSAHALLTWPLPVLVLFHVLTVFYF